MITDQPHTADIAGSNGKAHQADIAESAPLHDEIKIPPFLERKYNLEILRRGSEWPWEAIAALGTREPIVIEPEPVEVIGEVVGRGKTVPIAVPVARSWRRDVAMVAVGTLLGGVIVGVFAVAGRGLPGEPNANAALPTATVPAVAMVASATATEVVPTAVVVVPPTFTAEPLATDTVEPTATAIVVLPTDTVTEVPTDTPPEPTEVVVPTRVPVRPTNTRVVVPVATATPEPIEPTATVEVVPTEVEGTVAPMETATSEPTAVVTVGPTESPTPLPGIVTPTVEPISTPTEPSGPPTPLPGILTPTPEGE